MSKSSRTAEIDKRLGELRDRLARVHAHESDLGAQLAEQRKARDEAVMAAAEDAERAHEAREATEAVERLEVQRRGTAETAERVREQIRELEGERSRAAAHDKYQAAVRAMARRDTKLRNGQRDLAKALAHFAEARDLGLEAKGLIEDATRDQRREVAFPDRSVDQDTLHMAIERLLTEGGFRAVCAHATTLGRTETDPIDGIGAGQDRYLERAAGYLPADTEGAA
jgi:chromosome segregation ATPase